MLNWQLIGNPGNWVVIFLMVFIGAMALNLVLHPWHAPTFTDNAL